MGASGANFHPDEAGNCRPARQKLTPAGARGRLAHTCALRAAVLGPCSPPPYGRFSPSEPVAKPNYAFEKRQRDLQKKQKKLDKQKRKAEQKPEPADGAAAEDAAPDDAGAVKPAGDMPDPAR